MKMGFSAVLIGECMIELQEVAPGRVQQTFGGDTLNAAIYMTRLAQLFPAKIDYVTALGCDNFSSRMMAFWEHEGVGSELVLQEQGEMPGLYYIELDEMGERHFSYWRGESAAKKIFEYQDSDAVLQRLGNYHAVYLSGISIAILTPLSRDRLLSRLLELAATGTRIYLDYNHRPHLWKKCGDVKQIYESFLPCCTTVFVGVDELKAIHDVSEVAAGHTYLAEKGVKESVIRCGAQPCSISSNGEIITVAAEKVDRVVDTTAAGDSFSAAYLLARNAGCRVVQAAKIAHRMAAYVIGYKGAIAPRQAMPDFTDIIQM